MSDLDWMRQALVLAERGRGAVEPNPLVGAVIVRDGRRVGEGWHQKYGEAHAEVNALAEAGEAARGATLYVTLEPCCHFGKTPPCTDAIIRVGIRRVVAALSDPFPQVAGRGEALLRAEGIEVVMGIGADEARRQNAPYLKLLSRGRPYVHAKWAMTLDGKIATTTGDSRWISNEVSRRRVHEMRGRMDAIIIGLGTALADDPLLTARPPGPRTAVRIVLDSDGRLPETSQLVRTAREVPTLIATLDPPSAHALVTLRELGCEVRGLPSEFGRPSVVALLEGLGQRRMTNVLVEGGASVLGSFFDADQVDEVHIFVAPKIVGGSPAKSPVSGRGVERITEALALTQLTAENVDGDIYLHGRRG